MQGVGEPALLVKSLGSEHSYSLRPSEARALEQATAVFWIGETMETFLIKPLQTLPTRAEVVELWEVPGSDPARGPRRRDVGGACGSGEDAGARRRGRGRGSRAWPWPWRDRHARLAGSRQRQGAGSRDRDHAGGGRPGQRSGLPGQRGGAAATARATSTRRCGSGWRRWRTGPTSCSTTPTNISSAATGCGRSARSRSTRPSGRARSGWQEIRARLAQLDAACVFAEPQFEPALVDTVIEGSSARKGVLDPLGASLEAGPDQYFALLDGLAGALVACLDAKPG